MNKSVFYVTKDLGNNLMI